MHSRIFQISSKPIDMRNRISSSRYDNGFVGEIADYTCDMDNSKWPEEWKWLQDSYPNAIKIDCEDGENTTLTIVDKKTYFKSRYETFVTNLKALQGLSLEQFCENEDCIDMVNQSGVSYKSMPWIIIENLKGAFDDNYGFYVDDDDEYYGLTTLDNLIRSSNDGDMWYLGSVIDYHF